MQIQFYYKRPFAVKNNPCPSLSDQIIVDTKTIEQITDHEVGQMLNYLKVTGREVGLLIDFKHAKLQWRRVVLQRT